MASPVQQCGISRVCFVHLVQKQKLELHGYARYALMSVRIDPVSMVSPAQQSESTLRDTLATAPLDKTICAERKIRVCMSTGIRTTALLCHVALIR